MKFAVVEGRSGHAVADTSDSDMALVRATINGDVTSFEKLVDRYSSSMLRVADQVTRNLDDAQEAVQDGFFKAHQNLTHFLGNSRFSTWLTRIVLNESIGVLRKSKRRATQETSLDFIDARAGSFPLQVADWHPNPEQLYDHAELRQILRAALSRLRPGLRIVFALRDVEGLSTSETAAILDLTPSTVKVRLHRARLLLRDMLSAHFCTNSARSHISGRLRRDAFLQIDVESALERKAQANECHS